MAWLVGLCQLSKPAGREGEKSKMMVKLVQNKTRPVNGM